MSVLTIIVVLQAFLGFKLSQGADVMLMSDEATAFLIVLLALLTGAITYWSSTTLTRIYT
jgi:hypothetical protein